MQGQGTIPGVTLPGSPAASPDSLQVSGTPDGPKAVAAIRISLEKTETAPILTLKVTPNSEVNGSDGIVNAYPATSDWKAEKGGPFADSPKYDPAGTSATGVRASDGTSYKFDLSSLVKDGAVDVVLAPGKLAVDVPLSPTFSVAFDPPNASAIAQSSQVAADSGTESAAPLDVPAPSAEPSSGTVSSGTSSSSAGGSSAALPSSSDAGSSSPAAPATAGAPVPDTGVAAGGGPRTDNVALPALPGKPTKVRNAKPLAIVVLVLALLAGIAALQERSGPPRSLSRFARSAPGAAAVAVAGPPVGGLAQFRRNREGAPPPLI
jgi:hypothetical protein